MCRDQALHRHADGTLRVSGLLSGMFADVTFHTDTSADTIVVPSEAILTNGDN